MNNNEGYDGKEIYKEVTISIEGENKPEEENEVLEVKTDEEVGTSDGLV